MIFLKQSIVGILLFAFMSLKMSAQAAKRITVAQDGTGDYTTVQAAFNSISSDNKNRITVFVKNGIYKEKLLLSKGKEFVSLIGEDKFNTVLTYDDHTGKMDANGAVINTKTSYSFLMLADNFTARNISFQNDAGPAAGQAVVIEVDGDRAAFEDCRIIGDQDILFTNNDNSIQYYSHCYFEGTTDFIFGSSTVWFEQCHIHCKKNSHITAASTPKDHLYGYVFDDCIVTGDSSLRSVSLGRPWRPFSNVIYMHCYFDKHIKPEGWSNWNDTENYKTARYSEYKNYGPGSNTLNRLSWTRQLSDNEARDITIAKVLNGWIPFLN